MLRIEAANYYRLAGMDEVAVQVYLPHEDRPNCADCVALAEHEHPLKAEVTEHELRDGLDAWRQDKFEAAYDL